MVVQHADHIPCFAGQQTRFQGNEGHRVRSLNHRPRRRPRLCEQTRRNIQRDHRRGVPVGVCNERSNVFARRATQAGAQQTINNQINILWPDDIRRMNHTACVQPCLPRRAGLFRQRFITFECQQRHADPRSHRKTGNHVTVTAVIAVPAHYQPVCSLRVRAAGNIKRRLACPLHQFIKGDTETVSRLFFGMPDRVRMPDGMWYTCGVFLHRMVRHVTAPRSQSVSAKN